ncbi:MAG: EI24 domain-containing protein [Bacteroidota bacterium]
MEQQHPILEFFDQFNKGLHSHRDAVHFIRKHKLWVGFWEYGWVTKLLVLMGLIASFKFYEVFSAWVASFDNNADAFAVVQSMGVLIKDFALEGYDFFFMGGFKYLMLILLEIIIFHVARRTVEIKTGKEIDSTFNTFLKAEFRMIKVSFFCFIAETLMIAAFKAAAPALGVGFLTPVFSIVVQCYFLGFLVVDNYNEIFDMTIRESSRFSRQYAGLLLAVGLGAYLMLFIPIIGTIAAPFISAVAATLVMNEYVGDRDPQEMAAELI